ncbi:MAG: hypothetical protein JNK78_07450 [Planctomycetes bacterium]|nr:hypothetical protein [Planctomycetota bacterium]
MSTEPSPTPLPWPLWQRVLFRYAACHYLLYAFPRPLTKLLGTIGGGLEAITDRAKGAWWSPSTWSAALAGIESGWQGLTTWMDRNGLAPYEVIHQPTGSGDTGHDFAKLLAIVAASLLLTAIWSLVQRRPCGHPRLGRWLHLVVRFDVAFAVAGYGFAKFRGGQFGGLELFRAAQEIGDTTPMGMVGTFMQAFPGYELFGGGGELLGSLLLFHRRTALLGAFVTIGVLTNVCALNWLCGVPVKLYSAHLLLFTIALLAPFAGSLHALFVANTPSTPVDLRVPAGRHGSLVAAIGWAWVLGSLALSAFSPLREWERERPTPELYGMWVVDEMRLGGREVPRSDATRWREFAIDRGDLAWSRDGAGQRRFFDFVFDPATGTASVKARGKDAAAATWTCERGSTAVQVDVPLLMKREDRGRRVDGTRRSLVLKGRLGDDEIEVRAHEKLLRIRTGFRLRQELPEGW